MQPFKLPQQPYYRLCQLTDCHLLATPDSWYQHCQPAVHLQKIVAHLQYERPDALILTGDLTQDHSVESYQLLSQILSPLGCPVFLVAGNHDDRKLLTELAQQPPFVAADCLQLADWQLLLLDSKGDSPAGDFGFTKQQKLQQQFADSSAANFWLFMHHHPLPLQCFIDQYGLIHQQAFWQLLQNEARVRGVSHGHAHLAYQRRVEHIQLVGCPASSVQFLETPDWQTVNQGPQWCEWYFGAGGKVHWQFKRI